MKRRSFFTMVAGCFAAAMAAGLTAPRKHGAQWFIDRWKLIDERDDIMRRYRLQVDANCGADLKAALASLREELAFLRAEERLALSKFKGPFPA